MRSGTPASVRTASGLALASRLALALTVGLVLGLGLAFGFGPLGVAAVRAAENRFGELAKVAGADTAAEDSFGNAVAVDAPYAVVGARRDDDRGSQSGSAYVFELDVAAGIGGAWTERQKLVASDGSQNDDFGFAVAIDGGRIAVGARSAERSLSVATGAVYVYRFDGASWFEEQRLLAPDGAVGDEFGYAVAIEGDAILVGAPERDDAGDGSGAAYVFRFDGAAWLLERKLVAADATAGDAFGASVALDGGRALVGAFRDDDLGSVAGSAYVFREDGGAWTEEAKLTADDAAPGDAFGQAVALEGAVAFVGAPGEDDEAPGAGAAYVFRRDGTVWSQEQKVTAATSAFAQLGSAAALDRGLAVAGAPNDDDGAGDGGAVYAFRFDGTSWVEAGRVSTPGEDGFGAALALRDDVIAVGAPLDDEAGSAAGAAWAGFSPRCVVGTVNDAAGAITDVLLLQGTAGGADRRVDVAEGERFFAVMLSPPAPGPAKYVVHANAGRPTLDTTVVLPIAIGDVCHPLLLTEGATPLAVWNNIGKEEKIGASRYLDGTDLPDPERAPAVFLELLSGDPVSLPAGTVLTFQGVILDPGASSRKAASATNAIVLEVL